MADSYKKIGKGGGGGGLTNPMTASGDIIVGGTAGAAARLAKGSDGQFLKLVGGTPAWAAETGLGDTLSNATSADNTMCRYDGTNNKTIQSSLLTIADTTGLITNTANATMGLTSSIADGGSAVAFTLDADNALSTAGAKLFSITNNSVEKFAIDKDGNITVVGTISGAGDTLSSATSADNTIARYDGTNNKTIQASLLVIDDTTGDIHPTVATVASLGTTSLPFKLLNMDNGVADGGTIFFNAGVAHYLQSTASGSDLWLGGFSYFSAYGSCAALGKAGHGWQALFTENAYQDGGAVWFNANQSSTAGTCGFSANTWYYNSINYLQLTGFDSGFLVADQFFSPSLRTYPKVKADSSNYYFPMNDAAPNTQIDSTGAVTLTKVGAGTITANASYLGNSSLRGCTIPNNAGWYNATALSGAIGTDDIIIEFDFYVPKDITSTYYPFKIQKADDSQNITFYFNKAGNLGSMLVLGVNNGSTTYQTIWFATTSGIAGYHRLQLFIDRSTPASCSCKIDGIPCRFLVNGLVDTSGQTWDMQGLVVGCSSSTGSGGFTGSMSNFKLQVGAGLSLTSSTTEFIYTTDAPKYGKVVRRVATATDYTLTRDDYIIGVTSTAAARAITIPATCNFDGQTYIIKDESRACSANNITITPASGTIEGAASAVLNSDGASMSIYCDGTNWFIY